MRGLVTVILLAFNTAVWGTAVVLAGVVKFVVHMTVPRSALRTRVMLVLAWLAEHWVAGNNAIFDRRLPTQWDVSGIDDDLSRDGRYLIISNHVSWVDIFVLYRVFHHRTPFIRFFLKRQLIYFPLVGQACWAMEFPFMRRYSPEYLKHHPEKRGKDLETTRRAAQRYRHIPVSILNFVEGTRFTEEKRADQDSPYEWLLRPRIGGFAFILASLGDQLDGVFDVTIAYPRQEVTMWRFVNGRIPRITVRARRIDVPPEFMTAAVTEPGPERDRLKEWVGGVWAEKDAIIGKVSGS
jgi:1-acyl-sn-glycerol-3-phosphate acyltransferase